MVTLVDYRNLFKQAFFLALEFSQINRLFRYLNRGKVKVLMYHSITPQGKFFANGVSPSDFIYQIKYLRKHYHIVEAASLDDPSAYRSDQINVVLTFDDGFKDNRTVATEVLRREGLSGFFFVIADCLKQGAPPSFILRRVGDAALLPAYRTVDLHDVRDMLTSGMVIGAHGVRHEDYTSLDYEEGLRDAFEAQRCLQSQIGVPVVSFSFPWGKFKSGQEAALMSVYQRIFLTDHGFNLPCDRIMFRNEVSSTSHLWAAASGALDFFRDLTRW